MDLLERPVPNESNSAVASSAAVQPMSEFALKSGRNEVGGRKNADKTVAYSAFRNAANVSSALIAAEKAISDGDRSGYDMRAYAAGSCANFHPQSGVVKASVASKQWVVDSLRKFCESFGGTERVRQFARESRERGRYAQVLGELKDVEAKQGRDVMLSEAHKRMLAARDPYELQASYDYLLRSGMRWPYGEDFEGARAISVDLGKAQAIAIRLVACTRFGGCSAGQLLSLQECDIRGSCSPGFSLRDAIRESAKPVEFALAQRIEAALLADSARSTR